MNLRTALIIVTLCTAGPAMAQTQPGTTAPPSANATQHSPGVKAPATTPADKPAEKLDPAKETAIRHLMDITETSKMGDSLNAAITGEVRRQMGRAVPPDQLPKFMETFSQKYTPSAPPSAVTDAMVPVYAKHFSMEEIQELVKFYESPLGQRVVKLMPEVVQQSQAAGAQIDQQAAIAALRGMETEYPQLKQMLPPDPSAPANEPPPSSISSVPGAAAPQTTPAPAPKLAPSTTPPQR
jgi:uncharacterized protein